MNFPPSAVFSLFVTLWAGMPGPAGAADTDGSAAAVDAGARWLQPFVAQARAAGWDPIAVDPGSPTRYVDLTQPAEVRGRGDYLETSIREERSAPGTLELEGTPFAYRSTSGRWVVDCRGNRFTAVAQTWYRDNGLAGERHAEADPTLAHWNPITPKTLGSIVRDWVCAPGRRP